MMIETTSIGDYSKPQNKHDEMLLEQFPNVPLSVMRDIYDIHKDFSEEQGKDFIEAHTTGDWTEYDKKYLKDMITYATYDEIVEDLQKYEKIQEIEN